MDHRGNPAFLVGSAAAKERAAGDDAAKRVMTPMGRVRDADGVDVSIEGEDPGPGPETTQHVAHVIEVDVVVAELLHFTQHTLARETLATARRRQRHQVVQKLDTSWRGLFSKRADSLFKFAILRRRFVHRSPSLGQLRIFSQSRGRSKEKGQIWVSGFRFQDAGYKMLDAGLARAPIRRNRRSRRSPQMLDLGSSERPRCRAPTGPTGPACRRSAARKRPACGGGAICHIV